MTDLEDNRAANGGGGESGTEVGAVPFFPASPPADAPPAAGEDATGAGRPPSAAAVVKGRITIEDEVAEKVAALAALEVEGVADLGGDVERALESVRGRIGVGQRRGNQGVRAKVNDREVAIDVTIVVEYGRVALEVATAVKANVARQANHMLGMRVTEVNVTVDDVSLPGARRRAAEAAPAAEAGS
ncbi:MAG TPA: Asp23/Gls24 family envelope stress response protein [Streptosporangiaceae bacterium]|nr:Asp23/Gls24 family envelope stress response protein [Streptosporangiaceae bacterium]